MANATKYINMWPTSAEIFSTNSSQSARSYNHLSYTTVDVGNCNPREAWRKESLGTCGRRSVCFARFTCIDECLVSSKNFWVRILIVGWQGDSITFRRKERHYQLENVITDYDFKGKVRPKTGHKGPEDEKTHSSTLSLTSVLDGVGG